MTNYFELSSPADMLAKAKREYERMTSGLIDVDKVFNFFVTAWAVKDYVLAQGKTSEKELYKVIRNDEDFINCEYLCNKGKHLKLTHKRMKKLEEDGVNTTVYSGEIGGAPLNELAINEGDRYVIICDGKSVDVKSLGKRILKKWEAFFKKHSL